MLWVIFLVSCASTPTVEKKAEFEKPETFRIAFGSCAHQERPQPIWKAVLGAQPDLLLMMGDNVYGDVSSEEDPALPELRKAYETARERETDAWKRLKASTPILATWDDHDYGKGDGGEGFALKEEAKALFLDHWGVPRRDPRRNRGGIYTSEVFGAPGRRVQVIVLDTRFFRSPLTLADPPGPGRERYQPDPDPSKTILGEAQWSWLRQELKKPAEVRVLVSSVQVIADNHGFERWGNLPAERERLWALLEETRAEGVVLLSGDRHLGAMYRREEGAYPLYEVTSSAFNIPLGDKVNVARGPFQISKTQPWENFGVLDVDWKTATLSLQLRGKEGEVLEEEKVPLQRLSRRR